VFIKIDFGGSKTLLMMRTTSNIIIFSNIIMANARRPYKRRAAKSTRRVSRKSGSSRKSIVKIVKSVISRQAEKKVWADYGVNQSIVCAATSVPTFENLLPLLSPGDSSIGRIGNEVRVKNAYIRGHVNILPYNATTNNTPIPCYVKMWVVSTRVINTQNLAATSIASDFFESGAANTGFQGNMLDIDFSPNKDVWIIHYTKTIKLGGISTSNFTVGYGDNSPMSAPFQFNYGKKLTAALKYNDATNSASNKNMFLIFQAVPATGQDGSTLSMAEYHYTTRVEYEDF